MQQRRQASNGHVGVVSKFNIQSTTTSTATSGPINPTQPALTHLQKAESTGLAEQPSGISIDSVPGVVPRAVERCLSSPIQGQSPLLVADPVANVVDIAGVDEHAGVVGQEPRDLGLVVFHPVCTGDWRESAVNTYVSWKFPWHMLMSCQAMVERERHRYQHSTVEETLNPTFNSKQYEGTAFGRSYQRRIGR